MFSFFKRKPKDEPAPAPQSVAVPASPSISPAVNEVVSTAVTEVKIDVGTPVADAQVPATPAINEPAAAPVEQKRSWLSRLKAGLAKTSSNLTTLFVGARIDDQLYDELEAALLTSDAGVEATLYLLDALKKKVKEDKLTEAEQVKAALKILLLEMLTPLQKPLELGRHQPMVMMIAGVNAITFPLFHRNPATRLRSRLMQWRLHVLRVPTSLWSTLQAVCRPNCI